MIHYYTQDVIFILKHKRIISSWIKDIITSNSRIVGSINVVFTNDSTILKMNNQFLSHDYYTDIITFDTSSYDELYNPLVLSGDIFISVDTVRRNAVLYNQNVLDELHRVIIHGILHLIGFDDLTEDQQLEMTTQENIALSKLIIND